MLKGKRYLIWFVIVFTCFLFRMNMNQPNRLKQTSNFIDDKCSHNILEPSKDSCGAIEIRK